jgi:glutaredoxin 3
MAEIEIYTTRFCPYCVAAKRLLSSKGVAFTEIDVSSDPKGRSDMTARVALAREASGQRDHLIGARAGHSPEGGSSARASGRMTVPQIFVGATHVGGCDELYALERAGKLDPLLGLGGTAAGNGAGSTA